MLLSYSFRTALAALALAFVAAPTGAQTTFADNLDDPFRVIQLANGRVLVSEGGVGTGADADEIVSFSATGGDRTVFRSSLTNPTGLLQLADGTVLVTTRGVDQKGKLASFTSDGTFIAVLNGDIGVPRDLIRVGDRFLVVDGGSQGRVVELTLSGDITNSSFITGLRAPSGIAQLADGRLLVTETAGGRVLAYNADGTGQTVFASGLTLPNDIVQVADGRIFITTQGSETVGSTQGEVAIFNTSGTRTGTLASGLSRPFGITQLTSGAASGSILVTVFGGSGADAGSVLSFGLPTSSDDDAPLAAVLGAPQPNPATGVATLAMTVAESQRVRVSVYDVLGREVAVAFDGVAVAGASVDVAVEAARLAPGTYVVRAAGETFAEARRLTVAR